MDPNFWKNKYKELWPESKTKEEKLRFLIENETKFSLEPFGVGAESNEYIVSTDINEDKGAPDYHIKGTNIYIEVTGPLSNYVKPENGFWIRPDKIEYARKHSNKNNEYIVLYFPSVDQWYSIHLNEDFFQDMEKNKKNDYKLVYPTIRGKTEKYIEIKFSNPLIRKIDNMIAELNNSEEKMNEYMDFER